MRKVTLPTREQQKTQCDEWTSTFNSRERENSFDAIFSRQTQPLNTIKSHHSVQSLLTNTKRQPECTTFDFFFILNTKGSQTTSLRQYHDFTSHDPEEKRHENGQDDYHGKKNYRQGTIRGDKETGQTSQTNTRRQMIKRTEPETALPTPEESVHTTADHHELEDREKL